MVLIEPEVHGDERGFLVETFRDDAWRELGIDVRVRPGQPLALARRTSCAGSTSRPRPGRRSWSAARGGGSATSPSTCAATRPPIGQWEGYELDDENHRQLFVPVGFGHGFCVLSESADVTYSSRATTTRRPRRDRLGRPRRRRRVADRRSGPLRARPQRAAPGRDRRRASLVGAPSALRARRWVSRSPVPKIGVSSPMASATWPNPLRLSPSATRCGAGSRRRSRRPTPAQALGWPGSPSGANTLICAPTGSGKTLARVPVGDRPPRRASPSELGPGVRIVYVSPLKALSYDIERNLRAPLQGIGRRDLGRAAHRRHAAAASARRCGASRPTS